MPTSTLTSHGQTTIPKPIRKALSLQPGDRVEFTLEDDRVWVRRAGTDLSALDGMLDHLGEEKPVSIKEMNKATRKVASEGGTREAGGRD